MSDDLVRRYQMVGQYTEWSMAQVDGDDVDYSSKTEWVKATDHAAALVAKDAEIARLRDSDIMPQHVIRVAALMIDALHVLDTEAVQIANTINRSGGVDGVQVLEDAEKIIKAVAGLLASELSGVSPDPLWKIAAGDQPAAF